MSKPRAQAKTLPWDPAEHLQSEEDVAAYREAALEEGDPALVAAALGDIARAKARPSIRVSCGLVPQQAAFEGLLAQFPPDEAEDALRTLLANRRPA